MEEKLGQSTAVLFKYEKLILAEEETTSAWWMWSLPCGLFAPCVSLSK